MRARNIPTVFVLSVLTALALAVTLVLARDGVRRAEAGVPPGEINITVHDNLKGTLLPNTCWYVYAIGAVLVDVVSDNNDEPACDSQGPGLTNLTDTNAADGLLRITIPGSVIFAHGTEYYVIQKQAPLGFSVDPATYYCDFLNPNKCEVAATDVFTGKPNIDGPWNVTFNGGIDICTVVITQTKGGAGNDPIAIDGCGLANLHLTGTVGGGQVSASGTIDVCGGTFTISGPVSWNGNRMSGSWACTGGGSGTFSGTRKPAYAEIEIFVQDNMKGAYLPNTCWQVFYAAFGKNIPVDIVSDNNARPACDNLPHLADLVDGNYGSGFLIIVISGALRAQYGDQWHVQQVVPPQDFNVDPAKFACDLSLWVVRPCYLFATDVFAGKPNIDGLWNFTFAGGLNGSCTATITQTKGTTGSDNVVAQLSTLCPGDYSGLVMPGTVGGGLFKTSHGCGGFGSIIIDGNVSWNGNIMSGTWLDYLCPNVLSGTFTGTRKPTAQQINITVHGNVATGPLLGGTCWQVFYAAFGKNIPVDIVGDNNISCGQFGAFPDKDGAAGSIKITISAGVRGAYGDQWHVQQTQAPPGYTMDPGKYVCDLSAGKCNLSVVNVGTAGDTDGDGCTDVKENGLDEHFGGRRDYLNPYDFYDVLGPGGMLPKDKYIDLPNDILGVATRYTAGGGIYDANFDRSNPPGGDPWDMGPPDGTIDLPNDILGVAFQYQHDCR